MCAVGCLDLEWLRDCDMGGMNEWLCGRVYWMRRSSILAVARWRQRWIVLHVAHRILKGAVVAVAV